MGEGTTEKALGVIEKHMSEEQIESSLTYGGNIKKSLMWIVAFTTAMNLALLVALMTIFVLERDILYFFAGSVPLILFVCFSSILLNAIALKKRLKEWLIDAVELQCNCVYAEGSVIKNNGDCKISVFFEYNGEMHNKTSGKNKQNPILPLTDGYNRLNKKYVGREFMILYSPKYDEVMIPKQ